MAASGNIWPTLSRGCLVAEHCASEVYGGRRGWPSPVPGGGSLVALSDGMPGCRAGCRWVARTSAVLRRPPEETADQLLEQGTHYRRISRHTRRPRKPRGHGPPGHDPGRRGRHISCRMGSIPFAGVSPVRFGPSSFVLPDCFGRPYTLFFHADPVEHPLVLLYPG